MPPAAPFFSMFLVARHLVHVGILSIGILGASLAFASAPQEYDIGVLNVRSADQTLQAWHATADALNRAIPSARFRVVPLDAAELDAAVAHGRVAFVLTNPSQYVFLESRFRTNHVATLVRNWDGKPVNAFGGVIAVRADRNDLADLTDLAGKRIAAVGRDWLGAYQSQAMECLRLVLDPHCRATLHFTGEPQDQAVHEVIAGKADAAFVRSGLIEEMVADGWVGAGALRVLERKDVAGFPQLLSTALYPEWAFAATQGVAPELAKQVAVALLRMPTTSPAARAGNYHGWTIPSDYHEVREALKILRLPPYDAPQVFSIGDVLHRYAFGIIALLSVALAAGVMALARMRGLHRTIRVQMARLTDNFHELEREIESRKIVEQGLLLAASVFEHSNDGILITDAENHIIDINQAFSNITGYERIDVVGKNPRLLQSGHQDAAFYQTMWRELVERRHWKGEIWNRRKDGTFFIELLDITAVPDATGHIRNFVGVFSDITVLRDSQNRLEYMAHFDALTNLPNRTLLADRLAQSIALAARENTLLAVCFVDLDGFKPINDDFGHHVGDQLLIEVAKRFKETLRAIDTVARLGGDEFVLLVTSLSHVGELEEILGRVMDVVRQPFHLAGQELTVSASIGINLYPLDSGDADTLMRHADQAMYAAKRAGRARYHYFDPNEDRAHESRMHDLGRIAEALEHNEFVLYYQPKVDMRSARVIGLEALIRWQHPERGLVPPGDFLPLLENSDLLAELDVWVMRAALVQLADWSDKELVLPVSVNLSARLLQDEKFPRTLTKLLDEFPTVQPALLELEILESAAIQDMARVRKSMALCQELGVSFALDDFGIGYSSLSHLKRLPVDTIKIDQSFIRDLLDNPDDLSIVEGIVGLANVFERRVIGEGVETPEHGVMLMRLGCDLAQGYGISRPLPAPQVASWCASFTGHTQWAFWAEVAWDFADFPLLVAQSDHANWIRHIARYVEDGGTAPDVARIGDHRLCRFGRWYYGAGWQRYGDMPEFQDIEFIHVEVHELGSSIVREVIDGNTVQARQRLSDLYALRDRIIGKLNTLQRRVATANAAGAGTLHAIATQPRDATPRYS